MAFDPAHLFAYPVEDVIQSYSRKDSAFYALSVGMANDPLDDVGLDYVDPFGLRSQKVLPSIALVLGYPGFWMVRPDTTVDPTRILHGTQSVAWHAPLPPEGKVKGSTKVVRIVDRGPGKHAMVVSERKIVDAESNVAYATLTQTHVLLGAGGFGGDPGPLMVLADPPMRAPDHEVMMVTTPNQALLYRLNGDHFALHFEPAMAARAGFDRPILHGMCVVGMATQALLRKLAGNDPSRLAALDLRFTAPAIPGETILIQIWNCGAFQACASAREGVVLAKGKLTLRDE